MKRLLPIPLVFALLFISLSCGKKGPLQPPIVRVPKTVTDVTIFQRGKNIILRWKNPVDYIDGNPIMELSGVEIWLWEKLWEELNPSKTPERSEAADIRWDREFRREGRLVRAISIEELSDYVFNGGQSNPSFQFVFPLDENFMLKKTLFSIRVKDAKKRKSLFSPPVSVDTKILPLPPHGLGIEVFEESIDINWESPQKNIDMSSPSLVKGYNVFRAEGKGNPVRLNSFLINSLSYKDVDFSFGSTYSYFVRAVANDRSPYFEIENSESLVVTPKDVFPPAPPAEVIVVTGPNILSMSWKPNNEVDLAGYRVWKKAEGDPEFVVLMEKPIVENTYTDSAIEKNTRYFYVVTAIDREGNESQKSNAVSTIIRSGF